MSLVTIDIREGVVVVTSVENGTPVRQVFDRYDTTVITFDPENHPEAQVPDTQPWDPFVHTRTIPAGHADSHDPEGQMWVNNMYTVTRYQLSEDTVHLSIRRNDRHWMRDWRHLQRIKSELCGPEWEAVELFPAESRLMDAANQFHLWASSTPFPIGYRDGRTVLGAAAPTSTHRQRPQVEPDTRFPPK